MAGLGREAIYSAFFKQLSILLLDPAGPFGYVGRRSIVPGGLAAELYPAFFFVEVGEEYQRGVLFSPTKVTLQAHGVIQSLCGQIPDDGAVADLNNLADAVEAAVISACGPTQQNTLSGLVQEAWINGRQVTTPATYANRWSQQVMAIEMVLPHSR